MSPLAAQFMRFVSGERAVGETQRKEDWLNTTVCGGRRREASVYVSKSNRVRVYVTGQHAFLLRYEGKRNWRNFGGYIVAISGY